MDANADKRLEEGAARFAEPTELNEFGALAPAEIAQSESASDRALRESLQDKQYEAQAYRDHAERELRKIIPASKWSLVTAYVDNSARALLLRDQLERMGWK